MESPQENLWGEEVLFGPEPQWSVEPEIESIKQTVQSLRSSKTAEVKFLTQGGLNKIYNVSMDNESIIMRV
ncbi:Aminoglycoside phosphotransferase [Penicillium manginii]|jgi:hypothetical protein|uniref:Aminoglycoside phosphotransferase n=1 Tax=Penicillium manginii TaxID=203109 RepID=UPI002548D6E6|nr:Aminoglycoside phosphotransferase [Penicillium manginii]KAJ5755636.1 Aminoglycoside phosphotransferase [Penicillium manginii]